MIAKKRLKEILGRSFIKVRFLQFLAIIFVFLISFSLVSLTNRMSASKKKLAKAKKLGYYLDIVKHFDITKYLKIARRILKYIKLKKRDGNKKR